MSASSLRSSVLAIAVAGAWSYSFCETKTEHDLREKLAASESARVAAEASRVSAERDRKVVAEALKKLITSAKSIPSVQTLTGIQGTLIDNGSDAQYAAQAAAQASAAAKAQGDLLQRTIAAGNGNMLIMQLGLLVAGGLGFTGTWLVALRDRRWARIDASRATASAKDQGAKLDQIHALVNQKMTEAMQNELVALLSNYAFLSDAAAKSPSKEASDKVYAAAKQIAELEAQVRDRITVTKQASEELAAHEA